MPAAIRIVATHEFHQRWSRAVGAQDKPVSQL
jgi:hypothetical protein